MVSLLSIPGYIGEHIKYLTFLRCVLYDGICLCTRKMYFAQDTKFGLPNQTSLSLIVLIDMPSLSGVSDMDYPLQGPGLLSVPNLPELSAVRRVPLPPELVEQFSRILLVIQEKQIKRLQMDPGAVKSISLLFHFELNLCFNLTHLQICNVTA